MSERVLRGAPASPGLATGRARVLARPSAMPARVTRAQTGAEPRVSGAGAEPRLSGAGAEPRVSGAGAEPRAAESARRSADELGAALRALERAAADLERIGADLRARNRGDEAEIVETGALMARDPALEAAVSAGVRERGLNAAEALLAATEQHAAVLASLPDALLAARADDVRSLGRRAARIATGAPPSPAENGASFVLVADDLGPADVAEHGEPLVGIALSGGAVTAHAAIVARSLGIPMTVQAGEELLALPDGTPVVVDGGEGEVIVEPTAARAALAASAAESRELKRARERAESALPAVTNDGRRVRVLVNAATPAEVSAGLAAGAEGAGLIRTELAFLDARRWPSKADHLRMLAPLLASLDGRTATVRVLDFGGDKVPPFLRGEPRRGLELLLAHPGALRAQLAAIAEVAGGAERGGAAGRGGGADLRVLLPLVRTAADVSLTRAIAESLDASVSLGAMIELPEAALAAHEIAAVCDFLSVGTNDLTHATLGTDRFTHGEAPAHDPRVLRHIEQAADAARGRGIPLEICGEAASDPLTVPLLVGLGADELSVGAARVGSVRTWIRELEQAAAAELARSALDAPDAAAVERLATETSAVG